MNTDITVMHCLIPRVLSASQTPQVPLYSPMPSEYPVESSFSQLYSSSIDAIGNHHYHRANKIINLHKIYTMIKHTLYLISAITAVQYASWM